MAVKYKETSFVFRLQNETNGQHDLENTLKHWDESRMFDDKQINAIESSNKNSLNQPTSIPSPFARIALVKTAFSEVAEHSDKSLASYQKIVSDSLDVAEIFFTFDRWQDKIEMLKWNRDEDLNKLKNGHFQLYKTLKTFLENDALVYNFDRMKCIYILKHKQTGKMIGATSPSTLFMSSANELKDIDIQLNNAYKAFNGITPLHERSWDFQKYLYTWMAANNENRILDGKATSLFQEFAKYLESQKLLIGKTEEIDAITNHAIEELKESYKELRIHEIEVLGKTLYQSKIIGIDNLTVDDILEDKIIQLPYQIIKESFFDGKLPDKSNQSYLLPIKEKFFEYYTINDLVKFIKINHSGDVVDVKLETDLTVFEKRYKGSEGKVIKLTFDCAIFPNVKFEDEKDSYYHFGLVCDFKEKEKYNAEFVKINSTIDKSKKRYSIRNETLNLNYQLKNYSLEGSNFDFIRVNYNGVNGLIIPKLEPKLGDNEFTFAVDFGTTNTHIEYKINNLKEIKAFDISKGKIDEKQVHWLHGGEDYIREVFDEEYIPAYTDEEFKLPMRTALSFGQNTNWQNVYPFEKASLDELYEKRLGYPYNQTETDLKWSDNPNNQKQVKVYIESLMYLLRNKVIIGNGNLSKTKIRWFYPVSMERGRYNNLKTVWNDAYKKYFGGVESNIISITESVAPFEYYVKDRDASNLVTIDIGGGTTDVVISVTGTVDYITSFRFAANAIFGDGYAENNRIKNGIIRQFINEIKSELKTKINENDDLFLIFDDMNANKSSADVASFLFSLKQNKKVKLAGKNLAENANLSTKLIGDTTQKITFIFFYAAIIYHLSKLMKAKDLQMPDKIVFSGNGSRVIPFFTNDKDTLKGFTRLIFEKVYEEKYHKNNLDIILNSENPKEATCKGGFFIENPDSFIEILKKKVVLHSNGTDSVIQRDSDSVDIDKESDRYQAIDDKYLEQTIEESKIFIQFVFDLLPFFSSEGYKLNDVSIKIAKDVCFKKLDIYAKNGWQLKKKEVTDTESIEETLFFYPIVGMLKELSDAICNKNLKD